MPLMGEGGVAGVGGVGGVWERVREVVRRRVASVAEIRHIGR
jgi:hypothetical protein